ncbi:MAG: hypothetical protein IKW85_02315 [Muribaculaceae bacterium]|nr:hypothetical protein [Muribaculaceae bacterium]
MKRYTQQQIQNLLDKFMNGLTTLEEEAELGDYFRTHEVPEEWEDYRQMFGYFDRGMEGDLVSAEQPRPSLPRLISRRWWGIAAAACISAAIVATVVLHRPVTTVTVPEMPPVIAQKADSIATPVAVEAESQSPQLAEVTPVQPAHPVCLVSKSTRRLQTENKKLAQENERLQRELADLKRRAFIIDLEANGFRAVQDEDGSIVLIDLEQELENELNNLPTTNIPAL